jgi:hypothetical protein
MAKTTGIRAERKTINGTEYSVTTLGGVAGFVMMTKLPKYFGGAIGALVAGKNEEAAMALALADIGQKMADPEFAEMVFEMLDGALAGPVTLVDGSRRTNFDTHFAGNYGDLLPLIVHAFQVNFASFFSGNPALASLLERAAALGAAKLPSLPVSPGKSPG